MPVLSPTRTFLDPQDLRARLDRPEPAPTVFNDLIAKAKRLKGLGLDDVAELLNVRDPVRRQTVLQTAGWVKEQIYGRRMVLFAPLYLGNECSNNCLYCAFRKDNDQIARLTLNQAQIAAETRILVKEGHKRLMVLAGESGDTPLDYVLESLATIYGVKEGRAGIRRINLEVAPLSVQDFRRLGPAKIGTYVCFQETYDPEVYAAAHPSGPKADYEWRLQVMHRAMEAGLEDVGVGALFGLGDWRFEVLGIFRHAQALEEAFGCGPHTVSVPRLEPAEGAPLSQKVPHPVSDDDFKYLVALFRIALPYAGIILSTREKPELRDELFHYGVSQISAGSRTNPGAYAADAGQAAAARRQATAQFSLGDHRSLAEVVGDLVKAGFVPSFCTGCYRKGRVGADFMDLAKPGLIRHFCLPNGLFSFQEYLEDFAGGDLKAEGNGLVDRLVGGLDVGRLRSRTEKGLAQVRAGERDVYY